MSDLTWHVGQIPQQTQSAVIPTKTDYWLCHCPPLVDSIQCFKKLPAVAPAKAGAQGFKNVYRSFFITYKIVCLSIFDNPIAGVSVRFTLDPGGEDEEVINKVTDANGIAIVQRDIIVGWQAFKVMDPVGWDFAPGQTNLANLTTPQTHTFYFTIMDG